MEKYLEPLHHLRLLNALIQGCYISLDTDLNSHVTIDSFSYRAIQSMIIIYTNSYLDEWNSYLIQNSNGLIKDKLIKQKKIAQPAIDRINKWEGIKEFRHIALAHNFRVKKFNYQSAFIIDYLDKLIIPEHISEISVLSECIDIATNKICIPFISELGTTTNIIFKDKPKLINARILDYKKEIEDVLDKIKVIEQNYK